MTTLAAWQFAYGTLLFGPGSAYPGINVTGIRGLRDMPPIRATDAAHLRAPGDYPGIDVIGARTIELDIEVIDSLANFEGDLAALQAVFTPLQSTLAPFTFQLPGQAQNRTCLARCRRRAMPINVEYLFGKANLTVQLVAPDPRLYDVTTQTVAVSGTCTNAGDFETRPKVTFTSPLAGTTLVNNADGGGFIKFQLLSGYTMPAQVVADCNARTLVDANGNNRLDLLDPSSTWFKLNPGANSLTLTGGGTAQVSFASAWMQ